MIFSLTKSTPQSVISFIRPKRLAVSTISGVQYLQKTTNPTFSLGMKGMVKSLHFNSVVQGKQMLWKRLKLIQAFEENPSTPERTTQTFCSVYGSLVSDSEKVDFLYEVATKLGYANKLDLLRSFNRGDQDLHEYPSPQQLDSLVPAYEHLFKMIGGEDLEGIEFLVRFRQDLLSLLRPFVLKSKEPGAKESYQLLDRCLKQLLAGWFSPNSFELKRITFDNTAGGILERMAKYEAVHRLRSLSELKTRLGPGRRCYAFFHPCMPLEPLVFVYVALLPNIPDSMDYIKLHNLTEEEETMARCATFYSISATQKGLSGVDLGNVLIKKVSSLLQQTYPNLDTFVTLSPIPGFRKWLGEMVSCEGNMRHDWIERLPETEAVHRFKDFLDEQRKPEEGTQIETFLRILDSSNWFRDDDLKAIFRPVIVHLCSTYLLEAKKGNKIKDPVANFHIRNGAHMEQLNWMADPSQKGLEQSLGMMINYKYDGTNSFENSLKYIASGNFLTSQKFKSYTLVKKFNDSSKL